MVLAPLQFSGRSLTPDVLGGIQQGQQVLQGRNILEQQRLGQQQAQLQAQQQQQASALARRGAAGEQIQTGSELAQLFVDNPDLAERVQSSAGARTDFQKNDLARFGFRLEQAQSPEEQQQIIQQRVRDVTARGGNAQDSAALLTSSPQQIGQFARTVQLAALSNPERLKVAQGGRKGFASAKTEFLPGGGSIQALPNEKIVVKDEQGRVVEGQDRVALFRRSNVFQLSLAQGRADIEVGKAEQVAEVKAGVDLRFKPAIQSAVKLAEKAAAARGEALTTLARSEAALPGLIDTIDTLKELAPIATSTLGGKVFDTVVKESGFGTTKGATARAKFIAIVANQVLPLLKETFGAAFTVGEGQELKATMGDPDASPAQKIAQLEAFIDQKRRSIETAQREVAEPLAVQPPAPSQTAGNLTDDQIRQQLGL